MSPLCRLRYQHQCHQKHLTQTSSPCPPHEEAVVHLKNHAGDSAGINTHETRYLQQTVHHPQTSLRTLLKPLGQMVLGMDMTAATALLETS